MKPVMVQLDKVLLSAMLTLRGIEGLAGMRQSIVVVACLIVGGCIQPQPSGEQVVDNLKRSSLQFAEDYNRLPPQQKCDALAGIMNIYMNSPKVPKNTKQAIYNKWLKSPCPRLSSTKIVWDGR
jgi:hypothetical protein